MATGTSWSDIRHLMRAYPKAPLRAQVVASGGSLTGHYEVLHDGMDGWYIDDGTRVEASFGYRSAVLWAPDSLIGIRDMHLAGQGWLKSLFQGRYYAYLDESAGNVLGTEQAVGHDSWVVEVTGLRSADGASFQLWVEPDHGVVLRQEGPGSSVVVTELTIGEVEVPR